MEPVQYQTRSFRTSSFALGIAWITVFSMMVMGTLILSGTPPLVTMVVFVGCIVLGVTWLGGDAVFRIDDEGLERVVTSLLTKRAQRHRFGWEMVDSYKAGRDLNRAWEEYDFLEIQFRQRGHRWKLANQSDPAAFSAFQQAFEAHVERRNLGDAGASILRRASFFETGWAKFFTLGCYLVLLGMGWIYLVQPGRFEIRHWARLLIVILPGVAYLTYRVFLRPGRGASRKSR